MKVNVTISFSYTPNPEDFHTGSGTPSEREQAELILVEVQDVENLLEMIGDYVLTTRATVTSDTGEELVKWSNSSSPG